VIGSFLVAKIIAYTLLGALLGLFGSAVQLSVTARGMMQLGIGVFMVLTGIRMVRPYRWLNFVVLAPPPPVRRLIRRVSRRDNALTTPLFLGGLTVMIPCGVTQAMMALAITTANPLAGAVTMAVFTFATSPMFFSVSLAANTIGKQFERQFNRIVAVLILILGYVAIRTGAILIGHPLPVRPMFTNLAPKTAMVSASPITTDGSAWTKVTAAGLAAARFADVPVDPQAKGPKLFAATAPSHSTDVNRSGLRRSAFTFGQSSRWIVIPLPSEM